MRRAYALLACLTLAGFGALPMRLALAAPPADAPAPTELKPDVALLLRESTAVYKAMKSYQHVADYHAQGKDEQGEMHHDDHKYVLALERPNKFCFKPTDGSSDAAVSDGKIFINYKSQNKQYTRVPAPGTYHEINIVDDVLFQPIGTYLVALMLQGDALADKDFAKGLIRSTLKPDVTESGRKLHILSAPLGPNGTPMLLAFDAQTHLLTRAILDAPQSGVKITETLTDVQVDKPIAPATFEYTPPAAARLMVKFLSPEEAVAADFEGKPAPDFTLKDREGNDVSLASLKGKIVVLDFWASWCGPCRRVMPTIQKIHDTLQAKDVVALGIDTADERADCDQFLKENPQYTLRVLLDRPKEASIANSLYKVEGIPTTIIIDKAGIVRTYAVGVHEPNFYFEALRKLGADS